MRTATLAKLSLTAAVGLGALIGQSTIASAGVTPKGGTIQVAPTPHIDPSGGVKVGPAPTTSTTMKPLGGVVIDPQPDPPFDPDLPLSIGEDDECTGPSCVIAPAPDPEPCTKVLGCDDLDLDSDPGCTFTHGCPEPCEEDPTLPQCNLTSDGGTTDGGSTGGTDGHGTTGGTDGQGTTGGTTGDTTGDHGGRLPHTGLDVTAMAALGLGLAGTGVALRRLGRRRSPSAS
jgi:hypothetical protein